ncbi:MAG: hypothetical protein J6X66_13620 [Lachnospiraceae bacterium]|nr:hypothetical protein [Lachnospiraceae bacterium]
MKRGRSLKFIVFFLLISCVLCSCGKKSTVGLPNVGILTREEEDVPVSNKSGKKHATVVTLKPATGYEALKISEESGNREAPKVDDLIKEKKAAGLTDAAIKRCMSAQEGRYMYDMMDASLHTLYAEILLIISNHEEDILVTASSEEELQIAFMCVFQDHPELFWIEGYSYSRYSRNGKASTYTFSGKYSYTEAECSQLQKKVDSWVRHCVNGMPVGAGDYEKVKYVYKYIIVNTDYVLGAPDNQNILSVMINGRSVCQGYAKALQYVLNDVGIPCTMVVGKVNGGEGHAWNLVYIDNAYYYVDSTWGDSGYLAASGAYTDHIGEVNYNYLNVTSEELSRSHTADNVMPMPRCVATEDNYYVREGKFFDSTDTDKLERLFDEARLLGENYVSFKCADMATYEEFKRMLLDERRIFNVLPDGVNSADYTVSDDLKVLSFWF